MGKWLESIYDTDLQTIYSQKLAEPLIVGVDYTLGILFVLAAVFSIFKTQTRMGKITLYLGAFGLAIVYFGMTYAKNFRVGLFFEHSIQMLIPMLLIFSVKGYRNELITRLMKITTAVTFVCHGLFAVGYYPVPGHFVDMMIKGFGMSEPMARDSLLVLGILDFVFAILIFVPKVAKPALLYGFLWGLLTSLARITTSFNADFIDNWFSQYFYEFLVRLGHFGFPLILFLIETKKISAFPYRQR